MIALLFLLSAFIACFIGIKYIFPKLHTIEQVALGWLVSVLVSSWLALELVALCGYTTGLTVTFLGFTAVAWRFFPRKNPFLKLPAKNWPLIIFITFWTGLFFFLFSKSLLPITSEGWQTLVYSYGDMALHSTYINYFAEQSTLSLQSPLFSQDHIQYPFLSNFHAALLVKTGLSLHYSLLLTSISTIAAALLLFYSFCLAVTKKAVTPYIASLVFFLNGGIGFWDFLVQGKGAAINIVKLTVDYTNLAEKGFFWSNVITTHLLPQRGFLFGFAFLVAFLKMWQHLWYQTALNKKQLVFLSFFVGLLPLFHTHTFVVLLPLQIWLIGWSWYQKKITLKESILSVLPVILIGGGQFLYLVPENNGVSQQLGWKAGDTNLLLFWWKNMGVEALFLVLSPLLFWLTFKKRSFEKVLLVPFLAIFVLCNVFVFQPNDWDNMKFFLLSFVFTAITTGAVMTKYWQQIASKWVIIVLIFTATASGILSVLYTGRTSWSIASSYDLNIAQKVKDLTPSTAVFLTSDIHNHPVPMIAGRAVLRGYRGWLWTHGINYQQVDEDILAIFGGASTAVELLKKYRIGYVFIGPSEREQYRINDAFFETNFARIYQDDTTVIYKI